MYSLARTLLLNVFSALKGTHCYVLFEAKESSVVEDIIAIRLYFVEKFRRAQPIYSLKQLQVATFQEFNKIPAGVLK